MELTLDSLQVQSFSSIPEGIPNDNKKTALTLLEEIKTAGAEILPTKPDNKMVELILDEKKGTMLVNGVHGPIKIFNNNKKLLLISTAQNSQARFKIGHLKKGRYILEAEHQFFEFVR